MKAEAESVAKTIIPHKGVDPVPSQEDERSNGLSGGLVVAHEPAGVASEAFRILRAKLLYPPAEPPPKVIALTSAGRREGRTTTAANLALALARADDSVLVVDCDLRNPALHEIFRSKNTMGLTNILVGEQRAQEVWQEPIPRLKTIPAGPLPPNPTELLSSRRFTRFLEEMRQEFDYVLVDAPPVGPSDSFVLAANGDAVLLIVHSQRTSKETLRRALRDLQSVDANVLGTVVNSFGAPDNDYYSKLRYKA
jgi:capsular exopolysaccharide synthesis family protein